MIKKDIWTRIIRPLLCFDETFETVKQQVGEVEIAKEKTAKLIRKYLSIFDCVYITSTDEGLMQDIFDLLKHDGSPTTIKVHQEIRASESASNYACVFGQKLDAIKKVVNTMTVGGLPNELWRSIFEYADWKTWLDLHLVSKASRAMAQIVRHGRKFIDNLNAAKSESLPEIVIQRDFIWSRSPHNFQLKVVKFDIEAELQNLDNVPSKPIFVPLLTAEVLSTMLPSLTKAESRNGNGVWFRREKVDYVIYYLEKADLFAVVEIHSTYSGCMGTPDVRMHTEKFILRGKYADIDILALEYCVHCSHSTNLLEKAELKSIDLMAHRSGVKLK